MGKKKHTTKGVAGEHLRSLIERIEKLMEEKAAIGGMITEIFAEARGYGFDTRTMRSIIKLRAMDAHDREEYEALLDIYKGALGMLNGTPLGEAALRRLEEEKEDGEDEDKPTDAPAAAGEGTPAAEKEPEEPQPTVDDAKEMARKAASEGKPVSDNPFPARDPRRAAWDEEWCRSTGTDGMELPASWRRKPKPKDAASEE